MIELCMDSNGLFENEKKRKRRRRGEEGLYVQPLFPIRQVTESGRDPGPVTHDCFILGLESLQLASKCLN